MTGSDAPDQEDKPSRFIVLEGPDGGPLSPLLREAAKERGWLINKAGHALVPRIADPDHSWRRFIAFLGLTVAKGIPSDAGKIESLIQRADMRARDQMAREAIAVGAAKRREVAAMLLARPKALKPEERALVDAYLNEKPPTTPKVGRPRGAVGSEVLKEKRRKAEEAVAFCTEAGFSVDEAVARTGATKVTVVKILGEMRERGDDLGLYEFAKSRNMSNARIGFKYNKPKTGD